MSKKTMDVLEPKSIVIGSLIVAASAITAWALARRARSVASVDRLFEDCECALSKLVEKNSSDYAVC